MYSLNRFLVSLVHRPGNRPVLFGMFTNSHTSFDNDRAQIRKVENPAGCNIGNGDIVLAADGMKSQLVLKESPVAPTRLLIMLIMAADLPV